MATSVASWGIFKVRSIDFGKAGLNAAGFVLAASMALASGAAQANVNVFASAAHSDFRLAGQNQNSGQQLNVGHGYAGPDAKAAVSGNSSNGASWNDFSSTAFGVERVYSMSSGLGGSSQDSANASFEDELVFNNLPAGTHGVATFTLDLTGSLSAVGGGYWDFGVFFEQDGAARQQFVLSSSSSAANQNIDRTLTFTLNFVSGVTQHIRLLTTLSTGDFNSAGTAIGDFSHTALWGGLQSVVVGGQDVTRAVGLNTGSGFDYRNAAIEGVPEPVGWVLMLTGFGGLGAMLRRRRAAAA